MPIIEWSDEYSLGLPAIDNDHRELIVHCNEYLVAVSQGAPLAQLAEILGRLIERTQAHFEAEELLLDRHGYPGLALHKTEHDLLLVQASGLQARFDQADDDDDQALALIHDSSNFIRHWLLDHICTHDRPYQPYLRSLS